LGKDEEEQLLTIERRRGLSQIGTFVTEEYWCCRILLAGISGIAGTVEDRLIAIETSAVNPQREVA
jgi:hypothetical protein